MRHIIKKPNDYSDEYVEYIKKKYDLQSQDCHEVRIPLIDKEELQSFDWNIGLICGGSGSGKSSILKEQFHESIIIPTLDDSRPIVSQFDGVDVEKICCLFESIGLSSIPTWLRTPSQLSMGEKARFEIAYNILKTPDNIPIVIDEYTSVVNRECAMSMTHTLQRYIRENNMKIILSSCHFDIIDVLNPDWIFNLDKKDTEIERIIYEGMPYVKYQRIDEKDILSSKYEMSQS